MPKRAAHGDSIAIEAALPPRVLTGLYAAEETLGHAVLPRGSWILIPSLSQVLETIATVEMVNRLTVAPHTSSWMAAMNEAAAQLRVDAKTIESRRRRWSLWSRGLDST